LPGGYLPRRDARGDSSTAPTMDLFAAQVASPAKAVVAGDVRANENIGLTGMQTLFAREHNRIVSLLPNSLGNEERFQIARRIVGAEVQYVTYNEFLPAMGVTLPQYRGYDPGANAGISDEFATVGFRGHSMVHGNPDLVEQVGLGPLLGGLAGEREYKNDEQIDNSLRSVLFQVPKPGATDPTVCGSPVIDPSCFVGVSDLGAIDVMRDRDHGMPSYNGMRAAYGLAPEPSFTAITGESTDRLPSGLGIDNPKILDFVQLRDDTGAVIPLGSAAAQDDAVVGIRRTTLAARLRAVYGNVGNLDAFTGMMSEPHARGSELGDLQRAMWKKQFESLRDGDRFFYATDPALPLIRAAFGIDYRVTLAQLIRLDTDVSVQPNAFKAG
jgi:peroxidase